MVSEMIEMNAIDNLISKWVSELMLGSENDIMLSTHIKELRAANIAVLNDGKQ